jgi:ferrochelatase
MPPRLFPLTRWPLDVSNYSYYVSEPDYVHGSPECTGVLLVNLGTPDAPAAKAVRRYLAQFLGDPRVIELPRWWWRLILHGIVLRTRPQRVAKSYAGIWDEDGSPLLKISQRQANALQRELNERAPGPIRVALGMSYGRPSIPDALAELRQHGARRIVLLPLYPQYSGSTSASVFEATTRELNRWRWIPAFRWIQHYADDTGYIAALAQSITDYRGEHGRGDMLLFSFHGVPKRYLYNGDPYHCLCQKTARLVAERLGLEEDEWRVSFQSRFGREPWLQPYTDETVEAFGKQGMSRLDVICPGFPADCLETLEEIGGENREIFEGAGGGELHYIPALNDRDDHIAALASMVLRHGQGWPETDAEQPRVSDAERRESRERALAMDAPQ